MTDCVTAKVLKQNFTSSQRPPQSFAELILFLWHVNLSELIHQEKRGVLRKVEVSEWATPIVHVVKPNGSIRLCDHYKVSLNLQLQVNQYPLPHPDELFSALNGGKKFTTLDLSEAYLQIELEEEAKNFSTINTHKGLYAFNRLPFSITSSPAISQCVMKQILPKMPGIVCYIDYILATGRDDKEHFHRLELVSRRIDLQSR